MKLIRPIVLTLGISLLLFGCSRQDEPQSTAAEQAAHEKTEQSSGTTILGNNQGKVLSSIQVSGYTYVEAETKDGVIWLAGSPTEVTDGEIVSWPEAAVMKNFTSKTLNRTFEEILFVSGFTKASDQATENRASDEAVAENPHVTQDAITAHAGSAQASDKLQAKVLSVQSVSGYTYLETEKDDGSKLWLAVPTVDVEAGQTVSWSGGSMMYDFTSKTLEKTFPEILFAGGVEVVSTK